LLAGFPGASAILFRAWHDFLNARGAPIIVRNEDVIQFADVDEAAFKAICDSELALRRSLAGPIPWRNFRYLPLEKVKDAFHRRHEELYTFPSRITRWKSSTSKARSTDTSTNRNRRA
jgi:hypothetical protein